MQPSRLPIALATLATVVAACIAGPAAPEAPSLEAPAGESPSPSSDEAPPPVSDEAPPPARDVTGTASPAPVVREGGALVRAPDASALYVADEDHAALRASPCPSRAPRARSRCRGGRRRSSRRTRACSSPCAIPGLLLVLRADAAAGLVEAGRVELPADAWGLAVTPDGATAIVTSAWTHRVSGRSGRARAGALERGRGARAPRRSRARRRRRGVRHAPRGRRAHPHRRSRAARRRGSPGWTCRRIRCGALGGRSRPRSATRRRSRTTAPALRGAARAGGLGRRRGSAPPRSTCCHRHDAPLAPRARRQLPFLRADHAPEGARRAAPRRRAGAVHPAARGGLPPEHPHAARRRRGRRFRWPSWTRSRSIPRSRCCGPTRWPAGRWLR